MKKALLFDTAVLDIVCQFTDAKKSFSAFDVTRAMRKQCNDGELKILDGTSISFRGQTVTEISHSKVREIVHDIFNSNDIIGYCAQDTGNYILYVYTGAPSVSTASNTNASQTVNVPSTDVQQTIFSYVASKNSNGVRPTLKQIQSAIRRRGQFTCVEIENQAKAAGLKIDPDPDYVSKNEVYV